MSENHKNSNEIRMHVPLQMARFDFHGRVLLFRSDLESAAAVSKRIFDRELLSLSHKIF